MEVIRKFEIHCVDFWNNQRLFLDVVRISGNELLLLLDDAGVLMGILWMFRVRDWITGFG